MKPEQVAGQTEIRSIQQWPELREDLMVEITSKQIDPDEVQAFINWVLLAAYGSGYEQAVPSKRLVN